MANLVCDKCHYPATIFGVLWFSAAGRWRCPRCYWRGRFAIKRRPKDEPYEHAGPDDAQGELEAANDEPDR